MNEIYELFQIQGSMDVVDRDELYAQANLRGAGLSDRQLTTLITEDILPRGARFGSKGSVWPLLAIDMAVFAGVQRRANISFAALRQLMPLWIYLERCRRADAIDLRELERTASATVTGLEATMVVPWMVGDLLSGSETIAVTSGDSEPLDHIDMRLCARKENGDPYVVSELSMPVNQVLPPAETIRIVIPNG